MSKFIPHCLVCNTKVGPCFSFASSHTAKSCQQKQRQDTEGGRGFSSCFQSTLCVGFYSSAWGMHPRALAVHAASARPGAAALRASPAPGSRNVSSFSNTQLWKSRHSLQCAAASSAQRQTAFPRISSGDFRVKCHR